MKNISILLSLAAVVCSLLITAPSARAQQTTAFTYQGQLRDGGTNANGTYGLTFKLFDAATSGNQKGDTLTGSVVLVNGLFSVDLDFDNVFDGGGRWLDITVQAGGNTPETLAPRVQLLPAPYALFATKAGSVTNGAVQNPTFFGTTDMTPLSLSVNNQAVLRLQPFVNTANIIGGYSGNVVSNGFVGATIAGGGASVAAEMGDGLPAPNIIGQNYATIGGGIRNRVTGLGGTVGGGFENLASGDTATVAGGEENSASGTAAMVAGGEGNTASAKQTFAAGANASAIHGNSFVWSDGGVFSSTTTNQFSVRAGGGVRLETGGSGLTVDGIKLSNAIPGVASLQVFYASGTFVIPSNVTKVMVELWGSGGGGGMGTNGYDGQGRLLSGGGGGGGEYVKGTIGVTPGTSHAITVGQGGPGGVSVSSNGTDGQASGFGGIVTATGGNAGRGAPNFSGGLGGGNGTQDPQTHRVGGGNGQTYYDGKFGGAAVGGGFGGGGSAGGFEPGGGGSGDGGRGANGRVIIYY